jgi:hypothetical protein
MPPKKVSPASKAELCANLLIQAAYDFNYLGVGVKAIGIPPKTACLKSCKGHGISDFCCVCNFNLCHMCGSCHVLRNAMWNGDCGGDHSGLKKNSKHTARVAELVKDVEFPEPVAEEKKRKASSVKKEKSVKVPTPIKKKSSSSKKISARVSLPCAMTVGATSAKVVRKAGGWTLKLSVELKMD